MFTVPKPYPKEFRDDVVNVARNREPGQHLKQIAADFGISESCLTNWMKAADVEDGVKPGTTAAENADLREARKRIRLLEQENEVLRRAAAYLSQANLPGKALPARGRVGRRRDPRGGATPCTRRWNRRPGNRGRDGGAYARAGRCSSARDPHDL